MTAFDKGDQPLDQQALADHIASALEIEPPSGRELEITYRLIKRIFNPTAVPLRKNKKV